MKKIFLFALAALTLGFTACVEDEVYKGITNVSHSPGSVTPDDDVTVAATTTGINSLTLKYKAGSGSEQSLPMAQTKTGTFTGVIPKQADGTTVKYYVEGDGEKSITKEYTVSAKVIDYTKLILNEVDGTNKCIEIFNSAAEALPLTGVTLTKDDGGSAWWTGGSGVTIPANGYYVIAQTGSTVPGADEATGASGISMGKAVKFELKAPGGASLGVFERGDDTTDLKSYSFQRIPNATGPWKYATPTTKAANPSTGGSDIPGLVS